MSNHVLVTGSAGRVGRAVVDALVNAGQPVVGFDLVATPGLSAEQCIVSSLADVNRLQQAAQGAKCIIHLAATPDDARFPRGTAPDDGDNFLTELVPNNIVGSYQVMETARKLGVPRVILASTGQVIAGHLVAGRVPVTPESPPDPRYLYACTKVFLEALGKVYAQQHGISVMAVRLGWCPRAGQEEELRQHEMGRDVYLSPGDAGRFFLAAATVSNLPPFSIVYATSRPGRKMWYDLSETTRLTGYEPRDSWPEGMTET
jgi:uronate dehydrogenase